MDDKTTVKELIAIADAFRKERDWQKYHDPKELSIALSIEAAELLELFRYTTKDEVLEYLKKKENLQKASHEVADVLYHVLLLAKDMGIDLSEAFKEKIRKTAEKYPIEKSFGRKTKYTEL